MQIPIELVNNTLPNPISILREQVMRSLQEVVYGRSDTAHIKYIAQNVIKDHLDRLIYSGDIFRYQMDVTNDIRMRTVDIVCHIQPTPTLEYLEFRIDLTV